MKVTRRGLAAVAAGVAAAARAPYNQIFNQTSPPDYGVALGGQGESPNVQNVPQDDPNWRAHKRSKLLESKAQFERWARGDFAPGECDLNHNDDPRHKHYDATGHAIASLKSVSAAHKVRMAEDLTAKRYRDWRVDLAKENLKKIIVELVGL